MHIIETKAPAKPFTFQPFVRQKLTAAERKIVSLHAERNQTLYAIIEATEPDRGGKHNQLHRLRDAAQEAFLADPTLATAEALHAAQVRLDSAASSFPVIDECIHVVFAQTRRELSKIVTSVSERALAALDEALKTHRETLRTAGGLADGDELADFEQRAAATREALGATIAELSADPIKWLGSLE
jgi:hypothetical protein